MTERRFLLRYLPFLLVRADTLLSRSLMSELEARGHSVAEWRILAALADRDGMTIGELADLVILPQPTVSRWVERLATADLVVRRSSPDDGRRTLVHITPAGGRTADELIDLAQAHLAATVAGIPGDELAALEATLHSLIDRLEAATRAAPAR